MIFTTEPFVVYENKNEKDVNVRASTTPPPQIHTMHLPLGSSQSQLPSKQKITPKAHATYTTQVPAVPSQSKHLQSGLWGSAELK